MYHYSKNNSLVTSIFTRLVIGLLLVQVMAPTVVFGISEITEKNQNIDQRLINETKSSDSDSSGVTSDDSGNINIDASEESKLVDNNEEVTLEESEENIETNINTGNATAGLEINNEINLTEIDTTNHNDQIEEQNELSTNNSNDNILLEITNDLPDLEVEITNSATPTTNAITTAETGKNTAGGNTVNITTGNAIAYTDVLNVVNTNIVNSDGLIDFINETLGYENFDLRDEFDFTYTNFDTSQSTLNCTLDSCLNTNTYINNDNSAFIENNIIVNASTGNNSATGNTTSIQTGNAYASANIINVANTNIVDSNYLLLIFNNFSDYAGDIILPNSTFFDQVLQNSSGVSNLSLTSENSATINNSIEVVGNSGNNQTTGDSSIINTGDVTAKSNVTNIVNQNIVGDGTFSMLIRVQGDWSGNITGLPANMTWRETDRGIEIISLPDNEGNASLSNLLQSTNNTAKINNNVQVFALTGDNKIDSDEAKINTGNAYAESSILNIANTNVVSSNWSNLIFTIYGNWSGDLMFGQPDLWLGIQAESNDSPIMPGSEVTYTYTVFNQGDTTATDVFLKTSHESKALNFTDTSRQNNEGSNTTHTWSLGNIDAGETKEFSFTATISNTIDKRTVSSIPLYGQVSSSQHDANNEDNEDVVLIHVGEHHSDSDSKKLTFGAHFDIEKTASQDFAQPDDTVDYTITFFNRGGQLYDALLVDILENEAGEVINERSWPLGEIKNWEKITVTYSMNFDSTMATGTYINSAQLVGFHGSQKHSYQTPYESEIAVHKLDFDITPTGRVLGVSDSICQPYLTKYLRYGVDNDLLEVKKLQQFLKDHLHLNLSITGHFDQGTEQGVRDFQKFYQNEILTPWNLERDSGYVYYTTQKKINELMCQEQTTFPLTSNQLQEITSYKNQIVREYLSPQTTNDDEFPLDFPNDLSSPPIILIPTVRQPERNPILENETIPLSILQSQKAELYGFLSKIRFWWQYAIQKIQTVLS